MFMIPCLNRDDIVALRLPVLIERWHLRNSSRSNREAWFSAFPAHEQRQLENLYPQLYRWARTPPVEVAIRATTISLIHKTITFLEGLS